MIPKIGILILILGMLAGCGTTTIVAYDGPCPLRPLLEPISVEQQLGINPHVVRIIADNQVKLKQHIKNLESLSGCTRE